MVVEGARSSFTMREEEVTVMELVGVMVMAGVAAGEDMRKPQWV